MASDRLGNKDVLYFKQQLAALLANTSRTVKAICMFVIIGYALSFVDGAIRALGVTPGYLIPPLFEIWRVFTFCFLEIHFWEVLIDILIVGFCGKLMEPLWGAMEMVIFFGIVNFFVAVLSILFYLILYICLPNPDLLFSTRIYGLAGYVAAVTVAAKQIIPDIQIVKTPYGKITNRNVPLILILITLILWLTGACVDTYPIMVIFGVYVSWIYLRFYQRHSNGSKGDMTDSFSFASFFPNVMQPWISVCANCIYNVLVKIRVCQRFKPAINPNTSTTVMSAESLDNERRRKIALKALSERLSKSEQPLLEPMLPLKHHHAHKQSTDVVIDMPSSVVSPSRNMLAPNKNVTERPIIEA